MSLHDIENFVRCAISDEACHCTGHWGGPKHHLLQFVTFDALKLILWCFSLSESTLDDGKYVEGVVLGDSDLGLYKQLKEGQDLNINGRTREDVITSLRWENCGIYSLEIKPNSNSLVFGSIVLIWLYLLIFQNLLFIALSGILMRQ